MAASALTIGLAIYRNIPTSAKRIFPAIAAREIHRVIGPLGYLKFSAWKDHYLVIQGNDFINRNVSVVWNDVVVRYDDKEGIIYSDDFYDLLKLKEKGLEYHEVNWCINQMVVKLVEQHRKGVRVFNLHKMFQEELEVFNA
jgi:hypothetical protein